MDFTNIFDSDKEFTAVNSEMFGTIWTLINRSETVKICFGTFYPYYCFFSYSRHFPVLECIINCNLYDDHIFIKYSTSNKHNKTINFKDAIEGFSISGKISYKDTVPGTGTSRLKFEDFVNKSPFFQLDDLPQFIDGAKRFRELNDPGLIESINLLIHD